MCGDLAGERVVMCPGEFAANARLNRKIDADFKRAVMDAEEDALRLVMLEEEFMRAGMALDREYKDQGVRT
jgi:hypothetical protein